MKGKEIEEGALNFCMGDINFKVEREKKKKEKKRTLASNHHTTI
jgi:hypothetical protein